VNLEDLIFDFTYYHSLKIMEVVFFSLNGDCCFPMSVDNATQHKRERDDDDDVYFRFYSLSIMEKYNGGLFSNAGAVVVCNYVVEKRRVWTW
jgi:hypothetical protein